MQEIKKTPRKRSVLGASLEGERRGKLGIF
jgi:hypothetical protein